MSVAVRRACHDSFVWCGEHVGVVDLSKLRPDRPGKPLGVERELRVDAVLVAARVEPMPSAAEVHGNEPVEAEATRCRRGVAGSTGPPGLPAP
jgi:hypothetical protein